MDGEEGEGLRLSKRFSDKFGSGEVDYKTKSGTAWSHSYLNQKPWHPLSYPNQRRKWIAEQIDAQRERRAEEISREVLYCRSTFALKFPDYRFWYLIVVILLCLFSMRKSRSFSVRLLSYPRKKRKR